jgi:hypothetical protein
MGSAVEGTKRSDATRSGHPSPADFIPQGATKGTIGIMIYRQKSVPILSSQHRWSVCYYTILSPHRELKDLIVTLAS